MIYQKILLATDLGPQSVYLLKKAVEISSLTDSTLHVLHVVEPPITYTAHFAEREKVLNEVKTHAEESLSALCALSDYEHVTPKLLVGSPQQIIIETIEKEQCDLVVLGSHGVGGYFHALGSTTRSLMQSISIDVLVVQVKVLEKLISQHPPKKGHFLWQPYVDVSKLQSKRSQSPKLSGSQKGFGEVVKRGPRKSARPPNAPYRGGTRGDDEETS